MLLNRLIVILVLWYIAATASTANLTFVELNCENLFDCVHDTLKDDYEYCEDGIKHWNFGKYWRKLNNIGREIIACGGTGENYRKPDLVALVEVENDSVLTMLTTRSLLRTAHYRYVMTNSDDERGIDVALLYNPNTFILTESHSIKVPMGKDHRPTRDILYAKGLIADSTGVGSTPLHILVVHAPSRRDGEVASEPFRMIVSNRLCEIIDSIHATDKDANIIIAGDFNDYHNNKSVRQLTNHGLSNVSTQAKGSNGALGTYRYQGEWGSLDQILVSESMLQWATHFSCHINDSAFLLEEDTKYGGVKPRRTFYGPKYDAQGFSDHLPLVFNMWTTTKQ